ncbi:MAG: GNAT family N-acetyltransferase [Cognatishimia sp.]|uniref:GNAT family N-acetyltransferase n=1 Tax=Cognatishimia sp. 1_MG-2023 TaxID=3062642 RepID=UPI0026E1FF31|nr:GNAT family N-acetyltransferase [Cognatishimia sp. 1_MG-2023]MDO6725359.1 GNAT family N-acetyltransferase [Cognatishimia sp. 1_MG-2023]
MMHDTIVNQPVIESQRFDLRSLRRSDQGLIDHYASDRQLARMTSVIPHPLPPGATDAFIARSLNAQRIADVWAMDGTKDNAAELMGIISLDRIDDGKSEIGYWVAPPYWNTGIASEAVRALIAKNPLQSKTMYASVFQDNPASARVLTNSGFQYLGDAETFSVARNAPVPTWTYSLKLD